MSNDWSFGTMSWYELDLVGESGSGSGSKPWAFRTVDNSVLIHRSDRLNLPAKLKLPDHRQPDLGTCAKPVRNRRHGSSNSAPLAGSNLDVPVTRAAQLSLTTR